MQTCHAKYAAYGEGLIKARWPKLKTQQWIGLENSHSLDIYNISALESTYKKSSVISNFRASLILQKFTKENVLRNFVKKTQLIRSRLIEKGFRARGCAMLETLFQSTFKS